MGGLKGRGIRALLNCCKVDDYNPYIREHAIMALRFALEGNEENQAVVRGLEKMGVDPDSSSVPTQATSTSNSLPAQAPLPDPVAFSPNGGNAAMERPGKGENGRATVVTATGQRVE